MSIQTIARPPAATAGRPPAPGTAVAAIFALEALPARIAGPTGPIEAAGCYESHCGSGCAHCRATNPFSGS